MSIRILSKKAFAIGPGAQPGNDVIQLFVTVPGAIQDMPDHLATDPTFLLASRAGEITVITGAVSSKMEDDNEAVIDDTAHQTAIQAFFEELKVMSRDDTMALGDKYDLSPANGEKMGAFKKRILEAWKLEHSEETPAPVADAAE